MRANDKPPIEGALLVEPTKAEDERGWFQTEFRKYYVSQFATAFNRKRGTWRGLHWQNPEMAPQTKLIRCIRGQLHAVLLDMRRDSDTYRTSWSMQLTADNRKLLLVPHGVALGYLTLVPDTEIMYLITGDYSQEAERGVRWDDPSVNIWLPFQPLIVSGKDKNWPRLK